MLDGVDPVTALQGLLHDGEARHDALRDRLDPLDLESVRRDYRLACVTIGREVDVHLPDGTVVRCFAETVDDDGRLRVVGDGASATVSAGDVHHVRHQPSP